jgi:hypothetical protein
MQSLGRLNNLRKIAGLVAGLLVLLAAVFLATRLCSAASSPGIPRIFKPRVAKLGSSSHGQTGSIDENVTRSGRALRFDPQTEQVIGDDEPNNLLRDGDRGYRTPFVAPEEV